MNGTELITYLATNAPAIISAVAPIVGAIITAVFLRSNTATTEFEKVKSGKFDEVIEDLLNSGQMTYTEFYKAKNFLKIAKKADSYYSHTSHESESNVYDFDWFIRYYEAAGNISDENMQDIWAKVLAGEVSNPSSFSLKIIDILRNMRKSDAELFAKFCRFSFCQRNGDVFLPNYDEYLKNNDIMYSDIMWLSEMGLIFSDGTISLNYELKPEPDVIFINGGLLMMISACDSYKSKLSISIFPFTKVGVELAVLVSDYASDSSFIEFGKILAKKNTINVGVHKIVRYEGDHVECELENLVGQ